MPFRKISSGDPGQNLDPRNIPYNFSLEAIVNNVQHSKTPVAADTPKGVNTKLLYPTATSDFIHHTYETLNKPSIFQSQSSNKVNAEFTSYKNTSKHMGRNSSLPRRLRKSKTPTPATSKANRYRPRSVQDNLIPQSSVGKQETNKYQGFHSNIYVNEAPKFKCVHPYNVKESQTSDPNTILKLGSDQDDDEGIGEGDISTGSKSGGRVTTSSSGASSGGSRSPDDDEDSSRLVPSVESDIKHVKSANRRYLPTMPLPGQGPPPRHLLPSKLQPSPAFKIHPIPIMHEPPGQFSRPGLTPSQKNSHSMPKNAMKVRHSGNESTKRIRNAHEMETLRIKGKAE